MWVTLPPLPHTRHRDLTARRSADPTQRGAAAAGPAPNGYVSAWDLTGQRGAPLARLRVCMSDAWDSDHAGG